MKAPETANGRFITSCGLVILTIGTINGAYNLANDRSAGSMILLAVAGLVLAVSGYLAKPNRR